MKIIITGPTGAVGMALIQKCIQEDAQVLAICHKNSERIQNIQKLPGSSGHVKLLEADLPDFQGIENIMWEKADVFYHLAWMGTTGAARNDMYLQNQNIKGTLNAVKLAMKLGCHTFIGAGSQAEYGRAMAKLRSETPVFPENGYGMAKLCAGQMSRQMCSRLGIKHIWVRILSVYGPYDGNASMITGAIKRLLCGGHASFTKGEQMWDYLYSADAAEALYYLANDGKEGKTYVLGSGTARPLKEYINELYKAAKEMYNVSGTIGIGEIPYADSQIMHLEADISEMAEDISFAPKVPFAKGIRETISFIKNCS